MKKGPRRNMYIIEIRNSIAKNNRVVSFENKSQMNKFLENRKATDAFGNKQGLNIPEEHVVNIMRKSNYCK